MRRFQNRLKAPAPPRRVSHCNCVDGGPEPARSVRIDVAAREEDPSTHDHLHALGKDFQTLEGGTEKLATDLQQADNNAVRTR